MSREQFSDDCPGCRPALIRDGKVVPDDDPMMVVILRVWDRETTLNERKAWHRVTCQNSQKPSDLKMASEIAQKMQQAAQKI